MNKRWTDVSWVQVVGDLEEGGDVLLAPGDGQGDGLLLRGLLGQQLLRGRGYTYITRDFKF